VRSQTTGARGARVAINDTAWDNAGKTVERPWPTVKTVEGW
jgi:hypothetical protein